jgi:serine/threonine protein kinase
MLAGFFPLDGATTSDWRFVRVCQAVIQGHSLTHTVFSFYGRPCPLSNEAVNLIDGMLSLNPTKRFTVSDVLSHAWLKAPPPMAILDDQENLPVCVEQTKPLPSRKGPEYRHVAFAPVGADVVGLGLQMSMELETCGVAATAEWAISREVNACASPVYRCSPTDTLAAPTVIEVPWTVEEAGPPLPLHRQRHFRGRAAVDLC